MPKPEEPLNPPLAGPADERDSLPKPELNPLINPVLGQNLGRWADVYFTSPPEKREEAVEQLLRELKSGSGNVDEDHRPVERAPLKSITEIRRQTFCPACQGVNQADERFCGHCGEPLTEEGERERQLVKRPTSSTEIADDDDLNWLRDKSLAGFEQEKGSRRRGLLYLAIGMVVVLAAFGYLQWVSLNQSKGRPQVAAGPSTNASVVKESHEPSTPKPERAATVPTRSLPAASADAGTATKRIEKSTSMNLPTSSVAAGASPIGPDEVAVAQELLDGRNGVKDSARAAQLLWKAVGRQNPKAALTLAELYARGEGVPKSCDQARLLLIAAAKKGVPEAGLRLRSLEADGCK